MPHPGWHTIARRPLAASPIAASPVAEPAPPQDDAPESPTQMSLDPETWICPFRVLRWRLPEEDTRKPRPAAFDLLLESMRDPHLPRRAPLEKRTPQSSPEKSSPKKSGQQNRTPRHSGNPLAMNLARRLEAVGRVLANPQRHILRVARYLARLPVGLLDEDFDLPPSRRFWQQGREAFTGCVRLLCSAIRAFNLCADPEPG